MSNDLTSLKKHGDDAVSVVFTKKQFSDFVFTHVQTPSEETRTYNFGFDVKRDSIKRIVDRISYIVETNNDLLNTEFSVTVVSNDDIRRKFNSYRDFFDIDSFDAKFSKSVSITLSFLIRFKRSEVDAAPEKQIVNFRFRGGSSGEGVIEIRSTEFSWPNNVFDLIASEFETLEKEIIQDNPPSNNILLKSHTSIMQFGVKSIGSFFQRAFYAACIFLFAIFVFSKSGAEKSGKENTASEIELFNHESRKFESLGSEQILNLEDLPSLLDKIRDAKLLRELMQKSSEDINSAEEQDTYIFMNILRNIPVLYWIIGLVVAFIYYLNYKEHARLQKNSIGRVWLANSEIPKRNRERAADGILESVLNSVFATIMVAALTIAVKVMFAN